LLDYVCPLTTTVVTFAGIAFGVLVGEYRACRFEHCFADKVFAGNQFQPIRLARNFVVDCAGDQWIDFSERQIQKIVH
jgi:hypothetical protein